MIKKTAKKKSSRVKATTPEETASKFEKLLKKTETAGRYSLRLYITGTTGRSTEAVANIRQLCELHLKGRYELEVIDIYQQPSMAADAQIIAAPTLVKHLPKPIKRMIGNLSDAEKVVVALDLKKKE